jgi:hypothetical protein
MSLLDSIRKIALLTSCMAMLGATGAANAGLIPLLFSTGVDDHGVPLADGSIGAGAIGDPHYSLVSVPAGGTTKIDVFTFSGQWVARDAISTWIAPNSTAPGFVEAGPEGNYDYRTTFNLAGFDPATASITGKWAADNHGFDILINGHSTGNTTEATTSDSFTLLHDFSISSNFEAGINTLDFLVNNSNGPGPNPTGLRVEILDATADSTTGSSAVPEPSSLVLLSSLVGVAGVIWFRKRLARSTAPA